MKKVSRGVTMSTATIALNEMILRFAEDLDGTLQTPLLTEFVRILKHAFGRNQDIITDAICGKIQQDSLQGSASTFDVDQIKKDGPHFVTQIMGLGDQEKRAIRKYLKAIAKLAKEVLKENGVDNVVDSTMDIVKSFIGEEHLEHPLDFVAGRVLQDYFDALQDIFQDVSFEVERKNLFNSEYWVGRSTLGTGDLMKLAMDISNITPKTFVRQHGFPFAKKIGKKRVKEMTEEQWDSCGDVILRGVVVMAAIKILHDTGKWKNLNETIFDVLRGETQIL